MSGGGAADGRLVVAATRWGATCGGRLRQDVGGAGSGIERDHMWRGFAVGRVRLILVARNTTTCGEVLRFCIKYRLL